MMYISQTPIEVGQLMAKSLDIFYGADVLEPGAGEGNLATVANNKGANVDCIELNSGCAERLRAKFPNVLKANFMLVEPDKLYDFVIMNPPDKNRKEHIDHAIKFLKPTGKLAAFVKTSPKTLGGVDFLEYLFQYAYRRGINTVDFVDVPDEFSADAAKILIMRKR